MSCSKVIYGDSPFIEDMGVLTTLCLLHDEVLLFGSYSLGGQFDKFWSQIDENSSPESVKVVEQVFQYLVPEGVVKFFSPNAALEYYSISTVELDGIESIGKTQAGNKKTMSVIVEEEKLSPLSRLILKGVGSDKKVVSSFLRDVILFSVAHSAKLPVVLDGTQHSTNPNKDTVGFAAGYLSHKALEKLALPQLRAYHVEDILEARIKLKNEFFEFKAAILDLVWLLHQQANLYEDIDSLPKHCEILIDTKVKSALMLLESAIGAHQNKSIRRILQPTGNVILELGKSLISPDISASILGGSAAILKATESIGGNEPTNHIASYIYKLRERKF
ncbi:hypothetical protein [Candidatus Enterovibrio escicola]|uniref:hypothetical protein n=1 Tax=Candidatus Enterovibrio escicola TaxID=1927127 RepID=UPI0012380FF9|nr:hypothetical protein [Candidatus Enterovibrio escacola]